MPHFGVNVKTRLPTTHPGDAIDRVPRARVAGRFRHKRRHGHLRRTVRVLSARPCRRMHAALSQERATHGRIRRIPGTRHPLLSSSVTALMHAPHARPRSPDIRPRAVQPSVSTVIIGHSAYMVQIPRCDHHQARLRPTGWPASHPRRIASPSLSPGCPRSPAGSCTAGASRRPHLPHYQLLPKTMRSTGSAGYRCPGKLERSPAQLSAREMFRKPDRSRWLQTTSPGRFAGESATKSHGL